MSAFMPCSLSRDWGSTPSSPSCASFVTRPESEPKARLASDGRSLRSPGARHRASMESPTLGKGVEVSVVVRSILTGRFDPGGPGRIGGSPNIDAGQGPGRRTRGTDRVVAGDARGRIRPAQHAHRDGEQERRRRQRRAMAASARTCLVVFRLAVVKLGDPARRRPAFLHRVGPA